MNTRGHLRDRLLALPTDAREAALVAFLCERVGALLQLPNGAAPPDAGFVGLGFDSLRAIELRDELANALALELRSTLLFDQPTPLALGQHLLAQLVTTERHPTAAHPSPGPAAAAAAPGPDPIAIVGAACRVPGAADLQHFWRLLDAGACAVVPIPPERMRLDDPEVDATHRGDRAFARAAGLLDDVAHFDAAFFGISPREASRLDPAQRLLLEVAYHALEHAAMPPSALAEQRVGVYVGARTSEFPAVLERSLANADAFHETGTALSTLAGRLAYTFGFTGPCYAIDTACSGSLVAVHTAVRALRAGECDVALAGGSSTLHDPLVMANLVRARMLSPSDRCRPFDAAADGYVRGEGCGAVVLKRLADAERDGDRVLAVVLGTAVNQDGHSAGLTVPHGGAQVALLRAALADAGLTPHDLHFVEAHGTGTQLGDPIEATALAEVFGERRTPLPIGSCKANVGHLEAAAGITGLLKAVLALQHRRLPRQLHHTTPTPHVAWRDARLCVPTEPIPLPSDGVLCCGVSAFGFSGTNCHVVLATAPVQSTRPAASDGAHGPNLLLLQAADPTALRALAAAHAERLQDDRPSLAAWCASAARRAPLPYRAAFVAGDAQAMAAKLRAFAVGDGNGDAEGCTLEERSAATTTAAARGAPAGDRRRELLALAQRWVADERLAPRPHELVGPLAGDSVHVELPAYPFQRVRHWPAANATTPTPQPPTVRHGERGHPLLGARQHSSLLPPGCRSFGGELRADPAGFLRDHRVDGRVRLPAAAMFELAFAAARADGMTLPLRLADVELQRGCGLDDAPVPIELLLTGDEDATRFALHAADRDGTLRPVCSGSVASATEVPTPKSAFAGPVDAALPPTWLWTHCAELGLDYGPAFRGVVRLWRGPLQAHGEVLLPNDLDAAPFVLHPALLDACFQLAVAALPDDAESMLPVGVDELLVLAAGRRRAFVNARLQPEATGARVDLELRDAAGAAFAFVRGLQLRRRSSERTTTWHLAWTKAPAEAAASGPARSATFAGWPTLAARAAERVPPAIAGEPQGPLVLLVPATVDLQATFAWLLPIVQRELAAASPRALVLVTHGAAMLGDLPPGGPPFGAALHGFWRTLAHEAPVCRPRWIDLDARVPADDVATLAAQLVAELQHDDTDEVVRRGHERFVPRLRRGPPADRLPLPSEPFRLQPAGNGRLDVVAVPLARSAPGPGEVEVAIDAAAVNWKDLLFVRGVLPATASDGATATARIGLEACGRITAVGPQVASRRVGERVVVLGSGCFASHVRVRAAQTLVLPDGIAATAAAGLPVVFCTVLHALDTLANVQPDETVLVHAAAGGVGLAALQLLRARGCRVLATAHADKQSFVRAQGAEVVGDTRRPGFAAGVLAATDGRGVDVVLNLLSQTTLAESLASLRPGGRFVELGKVRVATAAEVRAHRPDVQHFQFDLGDADGADDGPLPALLARLGLGLAAGHLRPLPTTVVPLAAMPAALRRMATGGHVGKVVLQLPPSSGAALRADANYLLTGGGGTLLPIATALLTAGARHLTLVSRSPIAAATIDELQRGGAHVLALVADVADRPSLAAALTTMRAAMPPLAGVVHGAGVLGDARIQNLTVDAVAATLRPKVKGALLLDELLEELFGERLGDAPLDFFVLTSSLAGVFGSAGQAAYAAANAFVDAFAAWRTARGRPTTAIAFGPWRGPGMTGRLDERHRRRLQDRGLGLLAPDRAAQELLAQRGLGGSVLCVDVRWPQWCQTLGTRRPERFAEVLPMAVAAARAQPPTPTTAAATTSSSRPAATAGADLKSQLRTVIARALGLPSPDLLHPRVGFREHGMDSLLAVDALSQLERLLGRSLPDSLLHDHPDLERLVAHLQATPPDRPRD